MCTENYQQEITLLKIGENSKGLQYFLEAVSEVPNCIKTWSLTPTK